MSPFTLILRSLRHHWRINAAVALGVLAATAVLTGALVVGDSVRGSLRHLALDRLGDIDSVLLTQQFFRVELAEETKSRAGDCYRDIFPGILLEGTVERPGGGGKEVRRASQVTVLGIDHRFWRQGALVAGSFDGERIVVNEPLAAELRVQAGQDIVIRLPQPSDIPPDSPLGRKTGTAPSIRLKVSEIIPAEGLGRFGLRPTQQLPYNVYVPIAKLQEMLDQPGKANATFAVGRSSTRSDDCAAHLSEALQPTLEDYGLHLEKTDRGYFNFTSDRMILEAPAVRGIMAALADQGAQPVLIHLANYIKVAGGKGKIPYSTIAAIDFAAEPPLGPLTTQDGRVHTRLGDDEIILNSWAADDVRAQGVELKIGDTIELESFEPESTHGQVRETKASFRLAGIAELEGVIDDRNLTPDLKGVTDKESIANWDPPFPYDASRVRSTKPNDQDEQYWEQHKATPKGFISLATGRRLWSSRFGATTSIRVPAREGMTEESVAKAVLVKIEPASMGFEFLPVRDQAIAASSGTTPFSLLFLGFSFFIIAAAVMLIALLFRLGVDQRASEVGLLLATGISQSKTRWLLVAEGLVVAALGALAGAAAGVGYAWLMLAGLKTWWLKAIVTPFLDLYVTPQSLLIGYISGLLIAALTIIWSLRRMRRASVRRLLSGQTTEDRFLSGRRRRYAVPAALAMLIVATVLVVYGTQLGGEAQAGLFFGSGALVLGGLLATVWDMLRTDRSTAAAITSGGAALARLAVRNGARAPMRSTLTIGLVAAATFLIVSISAFRLDPPNDTCNPNTGSGGFQLVAQSDLPIYVNLATSEGREEAGLDTAANKQAADATIIPLRVKSGDDASCLNLYQPRQPRVVAVNDALINHGGFVWADTAAQTDEERANPWLLLKRPADSAPDDNDATADAERLSKKPVPVVLDQNTAMYSLHLYRGVGEEFEIDVEGGGKLRLVVVGLLKNSIFQGELLIAEEAFKAIYPEVNGYRYFLIAHQGATEQTDRLQQTFENALGDYGFDVEKTRDRLANFMAVQNTYLSTFQSLGGLGLLLGTFGLAIVQLRNVLERRGELALMRATGFRRRRLAEMVMLENAALLLFGLGTGIIAALVAILPNLLRGDASIPWLSLFGTLALVLVIGLLAGLSAVRATLRAPLLAALRGE